MTKKKQQQNYLKKQNENYDKVFIDTKFYDVLLCFNLRYYDYSI